MSQPTMIIGYFCSDITTTSHQTRVMDLSCKVVRQGVSSRDSLFIIGYLVNGIVTNSFPSQDSGLQLIFNKENKTNGSASYIKPLQWREKHLKWVKRKPCRGYECLLAAVPMSMVLEFLIYN